MREQLHSKCLSYLSFSVSSLLHDLAVKDYNRGRHLRVEGVKQRGAYDKIGEVQRRHAQDKKGRTKMLS